MVWCQIAGMLTCFFLSYLLTFLLTYCGYTHRLLHGGSWLAAPAMALPERDPLPPSPYPPRAGRWELGKVEGKRGQGQRRKLVVSVEEVEHEIDPKEATQFEPSHAQDLPNMVMMGNLHEAPLLYLLQRRLKNGDIYTWAGDVLISLNPYSPIASLYQV